MSASMAEVLVAHILTADDTCACTCDEMFYDWRLPEDQIKVEHSLHVEERLAANGYGKLEEASRELKFLRGERKTLGRELDSFESQEHTTVTIKYLRRFLGRRPE